MDHQNVVLNLPESLLRNVSSVAVAQNVTIGHLARELLQNEVDRRLSMRMPKQAGDMRAAGLRASLATEMTLADGWGDLAMRLCDHGYELRPAGGGVAIYRRRCGTRLCNAAALGFAYPELVKRFECAMPEHPAGAPTFAVEKPLPRQPRLPLEGDTTFEVKDFDP